MTVWRAGVSVLVFAVVCGVSSPSKADPKPWIFGWWPTHWENLSWEPYLEDATHPQNKQWDNVVWQPSDWAAQNPKGSAGVIQGFYKARILHRQYMDDDVPVLEVGPNFYHLSGQDKRRVTDLINAEYQITTSRENGLFLVNDWRTGNPIGVYTSHGLQLQ